MTLGSCSGSSYAAREGVFLVAAALGLKLRAFMPPLSLVVLHHDKAAYSRACLDSLLACSARPLQIVNVDNGSRDDTPRVLDDWEARAQTAGIETVRLAFKDNIGAIGGRNEALKRCRGEHIAFLDNDTVCAQSDWLERLRDFLDSKPDCALVCPKLVFPWAPFDIECVGAGVSQSGRIQYIGRGDGRTSRVEPFQIQCAISAAWLARRSVFERIGDLDEAFSPVQYEDLDWCFRARGAGFSLWADPRVEVFHFEHTTTAGSSDINFRYVTAKNSLEFKRRWSQMFAIENGPSDDECKWRDIARRTIDEVDVASLWSRAESKEHHSELDVRLAPDPNVPPAMSKEHPSDLDEGVASLGAKHLAQDATFSGQEVAQNAASLLPREGVTP